MATSEDDDENDKDETKKKKNTALLPTGLMEFWENRMAPLVPSLTVGVVSFLAGAVLSLGLVLIPIYNDVESLAEPVTLFETILGDLEKGYVEQVDTQKLFETGVNAMLQTLDPYTEFEPKQQAVALTESIGGTYGGVGLVISGAGQSQVDLLNQMEQQQQESSNTKVPFKTISTQDDNNDDDMIGENGLTLQEQRRAVEKAKDRGVRVVSAFEGYAFDYGMRVGDKLVAIDNQEITPTTSVDRVREMLRGEPDTLVKISFQREGVKGIQTIAMPRTIVQIRSVKLATLLGDPKDGMGYIQLSGFSANSGQEVRQAILALQRAALDATQGASTLKGLVLDLRGNPGGLLTSAVDVSSLLVPKGSDIVSARGRGFPGVLYKSRVDPIVNPNDTKLAVLVNGGTASAAEIVSGAVQDLDVGLIVGSDRTFGKGLVQNVEDLPFDTALKFTVAKYYTPSGRCIQGVNYKEGSGKETKFQASRVAEKDKGIFYTKRGRQVRDGGGIEADVKVASPKASALEVTLLQAGVFGDFAAQWSRNHQLDNNHHGLEVNDDMYREFQAFVDQKQKDGDLQLEALYNGPLKELKSALQKSGYNQKGSSSTIAKELDTLQASIVQEVRKDFERYRHDIQEDMSQSILARYLPERMLIERGLQTDTQVMEAVKLLSNQGKFDKLLARNRHQRPKTVTAMSSSSSTTTTSSSVNTVSRNSRGDVVEHEQQGEIVDDDGSDGSTTTVGLRR